MDLSSAPFLARLTVALQTEDWEGFEKSLDEVSLEELARSTRFAAATCFHLAAGAPFPWLERLLSSPAINSAALRQSNLLCQALESGAYDCVALLWQHGVRVEQPDRWNSLLVQALAHDSRNLELSQWPAPLFPGEALVAQAAAFRLLNPAFDPLKLESLDTLRRPEWKGFSFEICLTLMRSPGLALNQFSTLQDGLEWAMHRGWINPEFLRAAFDALPKPTTDFEDQQRQEATALKKAVTSLHTQCRFQQQLEDGGNTEGRRRL